MNHKDQTPFSPCLLLYWRMPRVDSLPNDVESLKKLRSACNCPQCGGALRAIGEDVSVVLEYVPEHWKVHRHVRPKYSCTFCEHLVQANARARPFERVYAGPRQLAHVVVAYYCDRLLLYRQSQIYARSVLNCIAPHRPSESAR
jgi:Transposase and inactivated derivatives